MCCLKSGHTVENLPQNTRENCCCCSPRALLASPTYLSLLGASHASGDERKEQPWFSTAFRQSFIIKLANHPTLTSQAFEHDTHHLGCHRWSKCGGLSPLSSPFPTPNAAITTPWAISCHGEVSHTSGVR